jgi:hypothetical protein
VEKKKKKSQKRRQENLGDVRGLIDRIHPSNDDLFLIEVFGVCTIRPGVAVTESLTSFWPCMNPKLTVSDY